MDERYEFIDTKSVLDSDGFLTDYTMYRDTETGMYVFIFGDNDFYGPEEDSVDHECETFEEAYEWFNDYNGFDEELDEIEECDSIEASLEDGDGYDDRVAELKENINKMCFHYRAQLHVLSDDFETEVRDYEDLSTHYTELKQDVSDMYGIISELDEIRKELLVIGKDPSDVKSSKNILASTYGEEDFEGTDVATDLEMIKNEIQKIYYRLGHLQDKWFDTDIVYELNDAGSQIGKAFTTIRTALSVYRNQ